MKLLDSGRGIYIGFDLTAPSLHWGHYLLIRILNRASEHYHIKVTIVLGDFTTQIGDATWRTSEREKISMTQLEDNLKGIREQIEKLSPKSEIVLNSSLYPKQISLHFLSELLSFFNLSHLLAKDFLSLKHKNEILTLKDAFYPALQSYDFYFLAREKNVGIQIGGQDQWGNITSGIEYIRRRQENLKVGALTIPLLTDSSGVKLGKSDGNTLFLDERLSSSYKAFQYFYNLQDIEIKKLASFIFSISSEEIVSEPFFSLKERVIEELFSGVYSSDKFERIKKISQILFSRETQKKEYSWGKGELDLIGSELPTVSSAQPLNISTILIKLKLSNSHSESKRLVEEDGCIFCFGEQIREHKMIVPSHWFKYSYLLIRKGEKDFGLFKLVT